MTEPTIAELYELVRSLHAKIDKLSVGGQTTSALPNPELNLADWIHQCVVTKEHLEIAVDNRQIEAFQQCILYNSVVMQLPIATIDKKTLVYDDTGKWTKITDEHLRVLIRDMWRKFVHYNLSTLSETSDDDTQDVRRRMIIDMRRILYDVRKNRAEVMRWIKSSFLV